MLQTKITKATSKKDFTYYSIYFVDCKDAMCEKCAALSSHLKQQAQAAAAKQNVGAVRASSLELHTDIKAGQTWSCA